MESINCGNTLHAPLCHFNYSPMCVFVFLCYIPQFLPVLNFHHFSSLVVLISPITWSLHLLFDHPLSLLLHGIHSVIHLTSMCCSIPFMLLLWLYEFDYVSSLQCASIIEVHKTLVFLNSHFPPSIYLLYYFPLKSSEQFFTSICEVHCFDRICHYWSDLRSVNFQFCDSPYSAAADNEFITGKGPISCLFTVYIVDKISSTDILKFYQRFSEHSTNKTREVSSLLLFSSIE